MVARAVGLCPLCLMCVRHLFQAAGPLGLLVLLGLVRIISSASTNYFYHAHHCKGVETSRAKMTMYR